MAFHGVSRYMNRLECTGMRANVRQTSLTFWLCQEVIFAFLARYATGTRPDLESFRLTSLAAQGWHFNEVPMKNRNCPETYGAHTAGELERERARKEYERIADRKRAKMVHQTPVKIKRHGGAASLHPETRRRIVEMLQSDFDGTIDTGLSAYQNHFKTGTRSEIRRAFVEVQKSSDSKFRLPTRRWIEETAGVRGEFRTVEVQEAEPFIAEQITEPVETGIELVSGWKFRLSDRTTEAAKAALVSCSDLAERLGYERASSLKELSEKPEHRENLNRFGQVRVSRIWVNGSIAPRQVDEPLFNRKQALYLIAKSGTAVANDLTVEFIEAFDSLVERFTSTGSALAPHDDFMRQMLQGQQAMIQSVTALTAALTGGLRTPRNRRAPAEQVPEQQKLPEPTLRTVEKDHDAILRNSPRIRTIPHPIDVRDCHLAKALRKAIHTYGDVTGDYGQAYTLVYQAVDFEADDPLPKSSNESRIQFICSQPTKYLRMAYECAYRVLVRPYLKAA